MSIQRKEVFFFQKSALQDSGKELYGCLKSKLKTETSRLDPQMLKVFEVRIKFKARLSSYFNAFIVPLTELN